MCHKVIRLLAVIALALSPVWGVQSLHAASSPAPAHYPVYPSALYSGCAVASNGYITCGGGGFVLTQVNSGYACTTLTMTFSGVVLPGSNPIVGTVTANSGSFNANFSVDSDGTYSLSIPGYLVNNLAVIQLTATTGASFFFSNVGIGTCSVPDTATPVPATNTPNPSDTSTPVPDTATVGPSHTPTPIPTFTPIPVSHSTFSPTVTVYVFLQDSAVL